MTKFIDEFQPDGWFGCAMGKATDARSKGAPTSVTRYDPIT